MNEENNELELLKDAIEINRENLLNDLLAILNFNEINETVFQELLQIIEKADKKTIKLTKALEAQEVIDKVLNNKRLL